MTYTINRSYARRATADSPGYDIGTVEFVAPGGDYILDGNVLPPQSVEHLLTFALQTLQDAYAGATDASEAVGAFGAKYDRLVAGTLGTRSGGGGVDEFTTVMRQVVRGAVKAKLGAKSPEWATFTGLDDADQNERLAAIFAKNEKAMRPVVEAKVAERAAERARKASLKIDISL